MLKKLIAFAAASAVSLSASAGYVQYNVNAGFDDGGIVSGFFVQDTGTRAVAYFRLATGGTFGSQYFASGIFSNITSASTYFAGAGPTSFQVYSNLGDTYTSALDLTFQWNPAAQAIAVNGWESASGWINVDLSGNFYRGIVAGSVVEVAVDPGLAAALDAGQTDGINNIIPTQRVPLPEPASIALLLVGGAGIAGLRRRRK